jgi:hypothetical protein
MISRKEGTKDIKEECQGTRTGAKEGYQGRNKEGGGGEGRGEVGRAPGGKGRRVLSPLLKKREFVSIFVQSTSIFFPSTSLPFLPCSR